MKKWLIHISVTCIVCTLCTERLVSRCVLDLAPWDQSCKTTGKLSYLYIPRALVQAVKIGYISDTSELLLHSVQGTSRMVMSQTNGMISQWPCRNMDDCFTGYWDDNYETSRYKMFKLWRCHPSLYDHLRTFRSGKAREPLESGSQQKRPNQRPHRCFLESYAN